MKRFGLTCKITAFCVLSAALILAGCKKEEDSVAKAVLASAGTLSYAGENAPAQIITVYSDATWEADVPEWVTIDPVTGSGVTDVTVSVTDNIRGGELDRPRSEELVFRGNTLASRAVVLVSQEGNKYRDVTNSTVSEAVNSADGTVVIVPEATVVALTTTGVVASDGKENIFVPAETGTLAQGDVVSFRGTKGSESSLPSITECDEFARISGGEMPAMEPKDISEEFDTYSSGSREYITFKGILRENIVEVTGAEVRSANIVSAHASLDLSSCNGHKVIVKGFFAGATESYVSIIASELVSEGPAEIIYWFDDFSWVTPYAEAYIASGGTSSKPTVSDCVKEKTSSDKGCPNIYTDCVNLGVNVLAELRNKGYDDLNKDMKAIYLQLHYFKYGATNKQSGLVLPAFDPDADIQDEVIVQFDWCSHMTSSSLDAAEMVVKIEGPGYVVTSSGDQSAKQSDPMPSDQELGEWKWMTETVILRDVTSETRITISPAFTGGKESEDASTYMRYYMDNIKVYSDLSD